MHFENSELYNCVRHTNDEALLRFLEQSKIASKEMINGYCVYCGQLLYDTDFVQITISGKRVCSECNIELQFNKNMKEQPSQFWKDAVLFMEKLAKKRGMV